MVVPNMKYIESFVMNRFTGKDSDNCDVLKIVLYIQPDSQPRATELSRPTQQQVAHKIRPHTGCLLETLTPSGTATDW
jgi:hypothetical protein